MLIRTCPLLAVAVVLWTSSLRAGEIPGVTGNLTRIAKDKENAATPDKVTVAVGDLIEIDWTYPVVPATLPTAASAKSSADAAKFVEIRSIYRTKLLGTGMLGALFKAEKPGKATLTFVVKSQGSGAKGVVLKCEVTVQKPQ